MDDLDSVLSPYWEKAQKATLKAVAISICFGLIVAMVLCWVSGHVLFSAIFGGMSGIVMWLLLGFPVTGDAIAPDELLQQVAEVAFVSSAAMDLRETLISLGYLTMGDIAEAFQNERTVRYSKESLEKPGAKALLGT